MKYLVLIVLTSCASIPEETWCIGQINELGQVFLRCDQKSVMEHQIKFIEAKPQPEPLPDEDYT